MQDWSPIASLRPAYVQLGSEALDGVGSWGVGGGVVLCNEPSEHPALD